MTCSDTLDVCGVATYGTSIAFGTSESGLSELVHNTNCSGVVSTLSYQAVLLAAATMLIWVGARIRILRVCIQYEQAKWGILVYLRREALSAQNVNETRYPQIRNSNAHDNTTSQKDKNN